MTDRTITNAFSNRNRLIALGAGGLLVLAVVVGLFVFGGPSEATSRDFTGAEVRQLMVLMMNDPELQADYLNTDGPVEDSARLIPYALWKGLLGEPATRTAIRGIPHWGYVGKDGQVSVTFRGALDIEDFPVPWLRVESIDITVSVSGGNVDVDRLRSRAVAMKKRVDAELESSGAIARLDKQREEFAREEAELAEKRAEEEREREAEWAKADEQSQQQKDASAAEQDFWKLRDELPVGAAQDMFKKQSEDWTARRTTVITEARHRGELPKDPAWDAPANSVARRLPLPTADSVLAALDAGKPIPVLPVADPVDAPATSSQSSSPTAGEQQPTSESKSPSTQPKTTEPPKGNSKATPEPSSPLKTREQRIAELTEEALNKRVSLAKPYRADRYPNAPLDKISVQCERPVNCILTCPVG